MKVARERAAFIPSDSRNLLLVHSSASESEAKVYRIRAKRRIVGLAKVALIAMVAVVILTPKDFDISRLISFPLITQAKASE